MIRSALLWLVLSAVLAVLTQCSALPSIMDEKSSAPTPSSTQATLAYGPNGITADYLSNSRATVEVETVKDVGEVCLGPYDGGTSIQAVVNPKRDIRACDRILSQKGDVEVHNEELAIHFSYTYIVSHWTGVCAWAFSPMPPMPYSIAVGNPYHHDLLYGKGNQSATYGVWLGNNRLGDVTLNRLTPAPSAPVCFSTAQEATQSPAK